MDNQTMYMPPVPQSMMSNNDDTIASRRWENNELIQTLWLVLAGMEQIEEKGKIKYVRNENITPLMNELGAARVIQVVRGGFVNPVMSLSNLTDGDARMIFEMSYRSLMDGIMLNAEEYGIVNDGDFKILHATLLPLLYSQIMRCVNGHEARNAKTQFVETTSNETSTQKTAGGFKMPFSGGKI